MNLTKIRRHWWMSIQEFAPILGIDPEDLEDYESGRREVGELEELFRARLTRAGLLPLPGETAPENENAPLQRSEFTKVM